VRGLQERRLRPPLTSGGVTPARLSSRRLLIPAVAAVVVAVDQITKWWALNALEDRPIDLVWTLSLRLTFNTGGAFSLGRGLAPFLAVAALVLVVVVARVGRLSHRLGPALGVALVLGGAVGNLTDRVFREGGGPLGGAVVDFIDLGWWPVFNAADIAIVIGAGLLLLTSRPAHEP